MTSIGDKLKHLVSSFESSSQLSSKKMTGPFFIFRRDGIVLFANKEADKSTSSSMGALFGGLWQAAETLLQFVTTGDKEGFRLSFDSGKNGIFILPIPFQKEMLFVSTIYSEETNPAVVKNNLRTMKNFLLENEAKIMNEGTEEGPDKKQLFENITDDEMDQLFSSM